DDRPLPAISLGPHRITRLVAGWNPIGGHSYLGRHMDQHMKEYFTVERTVEFLLSCEREGINAHQFSQSESAAEILQAVRERGSKMHFICLHAGRDGIKDLVAATRPIAVAHHGGVTDRLFADGKSGEVHDFVKECHDRGVLAGVSAHNPDCIRRIADEGWAVDFFMACFYFLTRKGNPPSAPQGPATLPIGYHFYASDPQEMTAVMRQVEQPCLGFKILAAGRKCAGQDSVREAFRWAFREIKPSDGVIVGMYPRFFDEIAADARYTRELAGTREA
ncbi:MAG: hypothetical protein JXA90_06145, partial [Planctomycetes bacterium]|nr:hypothetical protein [Planctomycetota bacterium]